MSETETPLPNALKSLERYASYSYGLVADRDGSWVRLSDVAQALQPEPGEVVVKLPRDSAIVVATAPDSLTEPQLAAFSLALSDIRNALRSALEESS